MQIFNIVKPRPDRNDSEKTYWDPIGKMFEKDGKRWCQIYSIGDCQIFEDKKKEDGGPY